MRNVTKFLILTLMCVDLIPTSVYSANILVAMMVATKSHMNVVSPLYEELAKRGHTITIMSPLKPTKEIPNIRNIVGTNQMNDDVLDPFVSRIEKTSSLGVFYKAAADMAEGCKSYFKNPEVVDLMKNARFDLIITTLAVNDCGFGLMHHFQAPIIYVCTVGVTGFGGSVTGFQSPTSFVPLPMLMATDRMNFQERVKNFFATTLFSLMREYYIIPLMEAAYAEDFPNAPGIHEMEKSISLVFSNGHFSTNYPRPMLPDGIDIGGMHTRMAKPLPKDLDDFLTGSGKDGFIYFSLGSIAQGSKMPDYIRKAFVGAFSKLKQRVLWKWETEEMEGLPPNVKLSKWIPQQDVLGHPNIKFFITHGGLLSKQEAVFHGVPVLGIPLFADQDWNVLHSEITGIGLPLELGDITEETLLNLFNRMLTNPQYTKRAKELSKVFRDQPETPLERAVFWTEYVIRHKGAHHMHSPARDLNFFQYHSIDVIATFLAVIFTILYLMCKIMKMCFRKVFPANSKTDKLKQN